MDVFELGQYDNGDETAFSVFCNQTIENNLEFNPADLLVNEKYLEYPYYEYVLEGVSPLFNSAICGKYYTLWDNSNFMRVRQYLCLSTLYPKKGILLFPE
ncbi:hypothetical protein AGMMS49975_14290 [Clostridia bacterium]|nr:hypothetical protein AGMMS49975_14290 [Clostridia bacterium]